LDKSVADRHQQ